MTDRTNQRNLVLRRQFKPVCYGILQPDGKLYMSESCICEDKQLLRDEVLDFSCSDEACGKVEKPILDATGKHDPRCLCTKCRDRRNRQ